MGRKIDPDVLDKVSAIWMLACNDVDPVITYRGIADRVLADHLKLLKEEVRKRPEEEEARKRLLEAWKPLEDEANKLVKDWPELFSPVVATRWFEKWQGWIIGGGHYPQWVINLLPDPKKDDPPARRAEIKKDRDKEIRKLEREDVFRSQFRAHDRQGRCTTDQVKLGIEHLDGLRKAWMEAREEKRKSCTILVSAAGVAASVIVSPLVTSYIKPQPNENSRQTARLTAEPAYESALDAMKLAFAAAGNGEGAEMQKQLTRVSVNLLRLEPLIEKQDSREPLWKDYNELRESCLQRLGAARQGSGLNPAEARKFDGLYKDMAT